MSAEGGTLPGRASRFEIGALVVALLLGAALRFAGLGFGLRHTPHWDERVFVSSVSQMLAAGDLDHRFYEYPGLFSYILAPFLALLPAARREGPEGYLLARGVVAAFGTLSIALAGRLGRGLSGPWAGITAALLVAVSPVEVVTAHMIRPDVVLESFVLLARLAFSRLSAAAAGDVCAGIAVGAATAVKFSGALLAPAYAVARVLSPGPKLSRLLLAGLVAVGLFFVATPYALAHFRSFFGGVGVQWAGHYAIGSSLSLGEVAAYYGRTVLRGLGPVGAALLALGLASSVREARAWAPLLTQVAITLAVFSTADRRYERFLVPILGLLAVLCGAGLGAVAARSRRLAALALIAAVAWPLAVSVAYVRNVTQAGTRDLALDWVLARVPQGARVLNQVEDMGLPLGRFERLVPTGSDALDRILARSADITLWSGEAPALAGFERLFLAEPRGPASGPGIGVYRPTPALSERGVAVALSGARLTASSRAEDLPFLADGRLDTAWVGDGPQKPGEWVEVELPAPVLLTRVELLLGPRPLRYGRNLHLFVSDDGSSWIRVRVASGRPAVEEQSLAGEGASQVLWIEPRQVRRVRLVQAARAERRWGIAELRLYEPSVPVAARR
jgi:hypothetical protein